MKKRIIYCNCGGEIIPNHLKESTSRLLSKEDFEVIRLSDLCGLCATNKELVVNFFSSEAISLIIACHPRAVKKLLDFAGVKGSLENLSFLNLLESSESEVQSILSDFYNDILNEKKEYVSEKEWPSWYPVIDYSRCTGCGQCADFCLFGVYDKQEGKVVVSNPKGCKNNCPACARICPHTAIIFPKYKMGGAISGSDSIDEATELQRQQQDLKSILGSDIYKALEQRKTKRQSIIRDEAMKKALEERDKAKNNDE